jgi:hypothetical protein
MDKMREVAQDIIKSEFFQDEDLEKVFQKFYEIMRKHGIKAGTPVKLESGANAIVKNTYEWSMAQTLFLSQLNQEIQMFSILGGVPEDIEK